MSVLQFDGFAHAGHRLFGDRAGFARTFDEDLTQLARPLQRLGTALTDGVEHLIDRGSELRLDLDVSDLAGAVARLQVVHLVAVRVERVVKDEDRIALDLAGDIGAYAL